MDAELGPVTTKADIWALGCIMIEMSGGTLYAAGMASVAIARQVCDKKVSPSLPASHGLPKPLEEVIKQCLTIDHVRRPRAAEVLQVGFHANVSEHSSGVLDGVCTVLLLY